MWRTFYPKKKKQGTLTAKRVEACRVATPTPPPLTMTPPPLTMTPPPLTMTTTTTTTTTTMKKKTRTADVKHPLLVSVLSAALLLSLPPAVSANNCPIGPTATLLSFGNLGFVNAGNLSAPTTVASGCTYQFYLPDRSELYLKLPRPSENHTLSVKWDYKYEYKPPMHVFSWAGDPARL